MLLTEIDIILVEGPLVSRRVDCGGARGGAGEVVGVVRVVASVVAAVVLQVRPGQAEDGQQQKYLMVTKNIWHLQAVCGHGDCCAPTASTITRQFHF